MFYVMAALSYLIHDKVTIKRCHQNNPSVEYVRTKITVKPTYVEL